MVPPNTLKTLEQFRRKKNIPGTLGNFVNQFHTWAESVNNLLILGVLGGTGGHFWNLGGTCSCFWAELVNKKYDEKVS